MYVLLREISVLILNTKTVYVLYVIDDIETNKMMDRSRRTKLNISSLDRPNLPGRYLYNIIYHDACFLRYFSQGYP